MIYSYVGVVDKQEKSMPSILVIMNKLFNLKQSGELYWNIMLRVRGPSGVWEPYAELFSKLLFNVSVKLQI